MASGAGMTTCTTVEAQSMSKRSWNPALALLVSSASTDVPRVRKLATNGRWVFRVQGLSRRVAFALLIALIPTTSLAQAASAPTLSQLSTIYQWSNGVDRVY